MIILTTTFHTSFGSCVLSESTGIILNNEMDDFALPNIVSAFDLPPSRFNRIKPQKKPLSSMCPAIIVDKNTGHVRLVIGGAGGTKITTATALVTIRHLLFGETIKEAIDAPRVHHQLYPNVIEHGPEFPEPILTLLRQKGHKTKLLTGRNSIINGISRDPQTGQLTASFDFLKKGSVDGF